jgi:hypothetical protein
MRHTSLITGPKYPALKTLAFLLRLGAVLLLAVGGWTLANVVLDLRGDGTLAATPDQRQRLLAAAGWLAGGLFGSLLLLAAAEGIDLFIRIERNTRTVAASLAPAPLPDDEVEYEPAAAPAPARAPVKKQPAAASPPVGMRLPWLEGDDPVEGSLARGR